MRENIAAHTTHDLGGYVDYISINTEEDGSVSITVREHGTHATLRLNKESWAAFKAQVEKN